MAIRMMTPDGKGEVICDRKSGEEWSSLGWGHWHKTTKGKNSHEFLQKEMDEGCPICEKFVDAGGD